MNTNSIRVWIIIGWSFTKAKMTPNIQHSLPLASVRGEIKDYLWTTNLLEFKQFKHNQVRLGLAASNNQHSKTFFYESGYLYSKIIQSGQSIYLIQCSDWLSCPVYIYLIQMFQDRSCKCSMRIRGMYVYLSFSLITSLIKLDISGLWGCLLQNSLFIYAYTISTF